MGVVHRAEHSQPGGPAQKQGCLLWAAWLALTFLWTEATLFISSGWSWQ